MIVPFQLLLGRSRKQLMPKRDPNKPRWKVGDRKYYIPGYRGHHLICILCTIIEVEDVPGGYYWLDEPIGHGVNEDDLLYQDEAAIELLARYQDELEADDEGSVIPNASLAEFRKDSVGFINQTRKNVDCPEADFSFLRDKEPWDEWFNPKMIFEKRKGVIRAAAIRYKGKIYWEEAPMRHNHAMEAARKDTGDFSIHGEDQGFILQDETFVDREEAGRIALEAGQISKMKWGIELYSEDLW